MLTIPTQLFENIKQIANTNNIKYRTYLNWILNFAPKYQNE